MGRNGEAGTVITAPCESYNAHLAGDAALCLSASRQAGLCHAFRLELKEITARAGIAFEGKSRAQGVRQVTQHNPCLPRSSSELSRNTH